MTHREGTDSIMSDETAETESRDIRRSEHLPDRCARAGWAAGPWDIEPDLVEWRHRDHSLALLVVRSPLGAWCGYVAVPPGHPLHGKPIDDANVEVHGGLTYADACSGSICHVPGPGEPDDVWWLGFDCGHAFDVMPGVEAGIRQAYEAMGKERPSCAAFDSLNTYRDLDYVMAEVESLAKQVGEAAP